MGGQSPQSRRHRDRQCMRKTSAQIAASAPETDEIWLHFLINETSGCHPCTSCHWRTAAARPLSKAWFPWVTLTGDRRIDDGSITVLPKLLRGNQAPGSGSIMPPAASTSCEHEPRARAASREHEPRAGCEGEQLKQPMPSSSSCTRQDASAACCTT